jgi:hypothetical protein
MVSTVLPSFSRGELSPALHGRVDTAAYHTGLATARNVIIHAAGGVSNRPGLKFIGPVGDHSNVVRLIPFKFKTTDTYILEFGHLYMRVIREDAHVLEAAKTISGATAADPVVITATSHGYSNGDEVTIASVGGMTEINGRRFIVADKTANTFELTSQADGTDIDGSAYTAYTSGGSSYKVYEVTTTYDTGDLRNIKFTQSADVMTLAHPDYDVMELTRTGHASWTLTSISFAPGQDDPTGVTATQDGSTGSTSYKYKVTAINKDDLEESLAGLNTTAKTISGATAADPVVITATSHGFSDGDEVEINSIVGMTELNGRRFTVANKNANDFELEDEDGSAYTAYSSGGTANLIHFEVTDGNATLSETDHIDVSWTAATDAQRYAVYRFDNGLYGLLGETETTAFIDDGITPDFDFAPPRPREPFLGTDNKPGAVSYYQQRHVYGGTNNKPDTSWFSQTGSFKNLSVSTPGQADDSITATLSSLEVNEIRHYIPQGSLIVLTSGEEWVIDSGENVGFEAATIFQNPQTRWGAGHQRPVVMGRTILFVQDDDRTLRSLGYSLDADGYSGSDMTVLAAHLFEEYTIQDMASARGEEPLIVAVRSDGQVGVLTFQQEQEVVAWTHWDTPNGKFESVAAIRPTSTEKDEIFYFVVERIISGNTVQYIERVHTRRFTDIRDAFFVDSGASLDTPITITASTAADPVVITAASHGFSNGDKVDINGITWEADTDSVGNETQPDQLNNRRFTVRNKATNTFELEDDEGDAVDGSAFNAYVEGGEVRATFTTLTGLHHLEGETIVALADGNVVSDLTVASGSITLPRAASRVHAGLKFIADVETLNIEDKAPLRTIQGSLKHIANVTVRFNKTRGMWIGPDSEFLDEMKQREDEDYGDPIALLTGDKEITIPADWEVEGRIFMRQKDPLPITILAVIPDLETEG